MTIPPTAREVIAREIDDVAKRCLVIKRVFEAFAKAGIPEAQLDSLLAGESVVVPKEPTRAMYDAARNDWHHNHGPESRTLHGENIKGIHRAMLQASQENKK